MNDLRARVEELVGTVKDRMGTDQPGPDTDDPIRIATYWIGSYFESKGYIYYSKTQRAKPEKTKLAERGWFLKWRVPSLLDPKRRPPRPKEDPLEHDPVAKAIRRVYVDQTLVKTTEELLEEARKEFRRGKPDVTDPPATTRELCDHLVKIAPALQTRHLFLDEEKLAYEVQGVYSPAHTPGYIRTEYWESVKTREALWAFPAFRSGRRASDGAAVWSTWQKVKALEKLAEYREEPFASFEEYEDEEVREALKELYSVDNWVSLSE